MARMEKIPAAERDVLERLECPSFPRAPWVSGPPLAERRVTIVSSAALIRRGDRPMMAGETGYRAIAQDLPAAEILMSHVSVNFDRTGFQRDLDSVLPRTRLAELVEAGVIGGVADAHYAFMGATAPEAMERSARGLARDLAACGVDTALLVPV